MTEGRPTLLTLDDDPSIAKLIASVGDRVGFRSTALCDADEFFASVTEQAPDMIVLDLQMPGQDGVGVLRYLADHHIEANVLLVSGMDERTMTSAEQYGVARGLTMCGGLQKPFEPEELASRLQHVHAKIRAITVEDLQRAIDEDELLLYYQPTLRHLADGGWGVKAMEALIRWQHPVRGLLTPDKFLSMGEKNGLSRVLTDYVIQRGIHRLKGWCAAGLDIGLRMNIAASLISDLEFPDRLESLLWQHEIDPRLVTLEITETAMLDQQSHTFDILTRLRVKNINLAIDDFGIGYSSLTQLFQMPFNEMKIDKSLVGRTPESKEASIMVDALVSLAHKLSLTVCAEGVETEETLDFLGEIGCDSVQGFYVSKPVPAQAVPAIVKKWDPGSTEDERLNLSA
ncbi:MAG: EAL domain-containing response regulator [Gammaproteobacteria bacterium]|jgi:EAL domain-containing protein (putative c-di-GMP-specific phosphodiesterase class I)/ActR/RegA family two-component response regulator